MKTQLYSRVEVLWGDAHSYGASAWTTYDNDTKKLLSKPQLCKTMGYLMPETNDEVVVLCGSLGHDPHGKLDVISGHMTIPRGMVYKIVKL